MIVSERQAKWQFSIQKVGIAWGFCMIVSSFNRIAIADLGLPAMLMSFVIGIYTLFGPLQPVIGRITDAFPIFGYRRMPYLLLGTLIGGCAFPFFPGILQEIVDGSTVAYFKCLAAFSAFGLCIAMQANTFLDLLNDVTTAEMRSRVTTTTWTWQALAMAGWAWVFGMAMPQFSFEAMQSLYNWSPVVMVGLTFLGVWKLETPLNEEQLQALKNKPPKPVSLTQPIKESLSIITYSPSAAFFFMFIIFSLLSVFLQDILQEVWAKDLFAMSAGESTIFQSMYNGLNTVGMAICGIFVGVLAKKRMQKSGSKNERTLPEALAKKILGYGTALVAITFICLAVAAYAKDLRAFYVFYVLSAVSLGLFIFPAISYMVDMTVKGQESKYLGLWSLAQVIGLFLSFTISGTVYQTFIQSGLLEPNVAFAFIFVLQAMMAILCYLSIRPVSIAGLHNEARGAVRGDENEVMGVR